MGYLSMAVTGTGMLVFTWSTVVLLGGFLDKLDTVDFWSVTVITFVQTRVFDVFLKGNISNIGYSFTRLGEAALYIGLTRKDRYRLCSVTGMVRLLVFTVLLCPLFALSMFGLFVSPWISLWRLLRTINGQGYRPLEETDNLKPALLMLYSLALLQGVLFYYWVVSKFEEKRLVKRVAEAYEIDEEDEARVEPVSNYLHAIRAACENDPSFARGRNFVTYAVDLMESNSPANYIHGARILDTIIRQINSNIDRSVGKSQETLIANMIGSSSSSDTIKTLVRMLDTKNPDDQETWFCVMRIVAYFAKEISLDKIMNGIRSISSLLEYQGDATREHEVFCAAMKILSELAKDEGNLKHMSNTDGITKKIVTVIIKDHYEDASHADWLSIARPGMQLINRVVSASSKSNNARHVSEILDVSGGITTLKNMLNCPKCKGDENLHKWVIQVLTQVIISAMSSKQDQYLRNNNDYQDVKEIFTKWLVLRFLHGSGKKSFRKLAGESLAKLSLTNDTTPINWILNTENRVADSLATILVQAKKTQYRKSAAEILEHLCNHYNPADTTTTDLFTNLKEAMVREIPKVLKRLIPGADSEYEDSFSYGYGWSYSYYVEEKEALAALCATVNDKVIIKSPDDPDRRKLDEEAAKICSDINKQEPLSFDRLLDEGRKEVHKLKNWKRDSGFSSSDDDDDDSDN
ncbi:hypothetical protein HU200_040935 [Digitaria exilis]|uniref:Uncharacterized protein n=1 Tax=Digitaria exilis TaxID=1010633 RepID=A0A835B7M9_9POAL|nr:hypothetical protein HU200_040935 [Digitaria exilis]